MEAFTGEKKSPGIQVLKQSDVCLSPPISSKTLENYNLRYIELSIENSLRELLLVSNILGSRILSINL